MTGGLVLDGLQVRQGETLLVDLSLGVAQGEIATLMAPSGAGKSTALAAILGGLAPAFNQTGRVLLNGRDVTALPPHRRQIGVMFQDDILFPHLSVAGNLAFALPRGTPRKADVITDALAAIDLAGFGPRDPATLSGGQRARVALMRSLLAAPQALLLDEPFSRLDAGLRAQIRALTFDLTRARGLPVILVTHDPDDARAALGPVYTPLGARIRP